MIDTKKNNFLTFVLLLGLAACSGKKMPERLLPPEPIVIDNTVDAKDKSLPLWAQTKGDAIHKIGKPYKVNGVWYFPAENPTYDEIGLASIYPSSFHGKRTANGEIYLKDKLTACHKTLPLPSVVRLTNLDNNQSVIVRVNDRGPFVNDRLVDVSPKVAEVLQLAPASLNKVRVEILKDETQNAKNLLMQPVETKVDPEIDAAPASAETTVEVVQENSDDEGPAVNVLEAASPEEAETPDVKTDVDQQPDMLPPPQTSVENEAGNTAVVEEGLSDMPPVDEESAGAPVEYNSPPVEMYYVQAGVFGNPKNAQNLSDKLSKVGQVERNQIKLGDKNVTSVRVGPFKSVGDAERALIQVKEKGVRDARLITDAQNTNG